MFLVYYAIVQYLELKCDRWDYSTCFAMTLSVVFPLRTIPNGRLSITTCFKHNVETMSFSTLFQRHISTLFQRHISTLKQRHISTLIRFNKIECLFNIEVQRCFNLYLPAGMPNTSL